MFLITLAAAEPLTEYVPAEDGTLLATDVYLPDGEGPWPVALSRTPYGKGGAGDLADVFNAYGFVYVIQDVRGRFESDGIDTVFQDAARDGVATLDWIDAQEWSSGEVVTYGASALTITQYLLAAEAHPSHTTILASVGTGDLYGEVYFPQGTFREALVTGWLGAQGSLGWLDEVMEHPYRDSWWDSQVADHSAVTADGVHVGGWYDIFRDGTITAWQEQSLGPGDHWLILGPWTHGTLGDGEEPPTPAADLMLEVLAGDPSEIPRVQYFVMGTDETGNFWRTADTWPPESEPTRWYLGPEGTLSQDCPEPGTSTWQYNPSNPAPTICGNNLMIEAGPCDQSELDLRNDTLLFQSEPLVEPVEVTGWVSGRMRVEIDQPDTELHLRLVDVRPDGSKINVTDAGARLGWSDEGAVEAVTDASVDLGGTSYVFHAGHRIGVYVGSANWPRFAANRNTGVDWGQMDEVPGNVVTVTLSHEELAESWLELPIPGGDPATDCPVVEEEEKVRRAPSDNCGCGEGGAAAVLIGLLWVRTRREYDKPVESDTA